MADVKALAENLVNLTVKEVQELAEVLKAEYGNCHILKANQRTKKVFINYGGIKTIIVR